MIKSLMLGVGVLGLAFALHAEQRIVEIWPAGKIPLLKETPPEKINDSKDDIVRLTNVSTPTLTIYPAPESAQPAPAVLVCPGGGYSILAWNHEGTEVAEWFNKQGFTAFVLKYRTPGQRDAAFCDAQRALRFIRANADEFKVNPAKLGIMGFSAGGHLTVRVSNNYAASLYEPVDSADKLSCRPDFSVPVYPAYLNQKGTFEMVDEFAISGQTPPTFIIAAEDDHSFVDCSIAYYIALKQAKVPAEMHLFPSGGHGFGMRKRGGSIDTWSDLLATWLQQHVLK
ncbi:MAG: alpha/beta hydrolase [Kiritimatiellae bacterium]|nr:alpha/beta hydrolase [Kiritimatiellia bacterium]